MLEKSLNLETKTINFLEKEWSRFADLEATAYYMSHYISPIHNGDKVLIHAATGGVGNLLIQLAKIQGAIVFAKVGGEKKETIAKKLGADYTLNYKKEDYFKKITAQLNKQKLD